MSSIDLAIEKAVEAAISKHLQPIFAKLNVPMTATDAPMTSEEASRYLGGTGKPVAPATLKWWRCMGHGPVYQKFGNSVRYRKACHQSSENVVF